MRYWAAMTVRELGAEARPLIPELRRLIKDEDEEAQSARIAALDTLGSMGTAAAAAVPDLLKLLDDEDPSVERHAALAILRIRPGHSLALDRLVARLDEDDDPTWIWHVSIDDARDRRLMPILLKGTRCRAGWVAQQSIRLLRDVDPGLARREGLE